MLRVRRQSREPTGSFAKRKHRAASRVGGGRAAGSVFPLEADIGLRGCDESGFRSFCVSRQRERDRKFVDSPLEGAGFELVIPATQYSRRERPSRYRANSLPRKGRRFTASRARRYQIGKSRRFFPGLTRSPRDRLWVNLRVGNVSVQTALSTDRRLAIRGSFHS
jgi:hypothetical protein